MAVFIVIIWVQSWHFNLFDPSSVLFSVPSLLLLQYGNFPVYPVGCLYFPFIFCKGSGGMSFDLRCRDLSYRHLGSALSSVLYGSRKCDRTVFLSETTEPMFPESLSAFLLCPRYLSVKRASACVSQMPSVEWKRNE